MVKKGCKWILVKGTRAGEACGKELPKEMHVDPKYQGYCYTHLHRLEEEDRWKEEQAQEEKAKVIKKMEEDDKTLLKEKFAFHGPSSTGIMLLEGMLRDVLPNLQKGTIVDFECYVVVMKR